MKQLNAMRANARKVSKYKASLWGISALWQFLFLILLGVHPPGSPGSLGGGADLVADDLIHLQSGITGLHAWLTADTRLLLKKLWQSLPLQDWDTQPQQTLHMYSSFIDQLMADKPLSTEKDHRQHLSSFSSLLFLRCKSPVKLEPWDRFT